MIIANPAARYASKNRVEAAAGIIRAGGRRINVFWTSQRGDAEEFSRRAAAEGIGLIIAAGGDGTINEAANGMARTGSCLAVLPMGTTNVLAKELGIPESIEGAVGKILNGSTHTVSLGRITLTRYPSPATRLFLLMAGIGLDGEAVYGIGKTVKRMSGKGAYIMSGLQSLLRYSPERIEFIVDGREINGYGAIIGKAAKYGGHFRVTPDASLLRPEFYAYIMAGRRRTDVIRYVYGILTGTHLGFRDIRYLRASEIEVRGSARVQIDGDYFGRTPAVVTLEPDALRMVF